MPLNAPEHLRCTRATQRRRRSIFLLFMMMCAEQHGGKNLALPNGKSPSPKNAPHAGCLEAFMPATEWEGAATVYASYLGFEGLEVPAVCLAAVWVICPTSS